MANTPIPRSGQDTEEQSIESFFSDLLTAVQKKNKECNAEKIRKAFALAKRAHSSQYRKDGTSFIWHPLNVATILVQANFCDDDMICAALLHDTIEDTRDTTKPITPKDIEAISPAITSIVIGLTNFRKHDVEYTERDAQNLRKIILASTQDPRVLIIKLADRLHNMRTISAHRDDKQQRIAKSTLDVYAPLAQKIGIYRFKREMEDLSFSILQPEIFSFLQEKIKLSAEERKKSTEAIIQQVTQLLESNALHSRVEGREKNLYAIYKKMVESNKPLDKIYDLYGVRVIVQTDDQCYRVLDLFTHTFEILVDRTKDYIKEPKPNGYKSIHLNVIIDEKIVEVQIRTQEMNDIAESGAAAYWRYKGDERDRKFERKLAWLRQLLRWKRSNDELQQVQLTLFKDEIVVITPKGDPLTLASGANVIDFAFAVHSGVGERMRTAKVNGEIVPFTHPLRNGDIVSIETTTNSCIQESWIRLAQMPSTQQKIRKALDYVVEGKKVSVPKKNTTPALHQPLYTLHTLSDAFGKTKIKISGCCNPKQEDKIVAYYTKDKKLITVHKFDCPNQHALDPRNKVQLSVQQTTQPRIQYQLLLKDEPGVLTKTLQLILQHSKIVSVDSSESKSAHLVTVQTTTKNEELVKVLRKQNGVIDCKLIAQK